MLILFTFSCSFWVFRWAPWPSPRLVHPLFPGANENLCYRRNERPHDKRMKPWTGEKRAAIEGGGTLERGFAWKEETKVMIWIRLLFLSDPCILIHTWSHLCLKFWAQEACFSIGRCLHLFIDCFLNVTSFPLYQPESLIRDILKFVSDQNWVNIGNWFYFWIYFHSFHIIFWWKIHTLTNLAHIYL